MGRGRSSACWPPAAPALLLLLVGFSHCVAAARLLPLQPAAVVLHQAESGVTAEAAADGLVLQQGEEAAGNGPDELSGNSEMMGGGEEEAVAAACEGDNNDDECLERRLLGDAHLDYIYTQHKGKP